MLHRIFRVCLFTFLLAVSSVLARGNGVPVIYQPLTCFSYTIIN